MKKNKRAPRFVWKKGDVRIERHRKKKESPSLSNGLSSIVRSYSSLVSRWYASSPWRERSSIQSVWAVSVASPLST